MANGFFFLASLGWNFGLGMTWLAVPLYASAQGLSNAEIGAQLYIGETTVKTHVTHILQKLGLRDRVQAVILVYQTGLFEKRADAQ